MTDSVKSFTPQLNHCIFISGVGICLYFIGKHVFKYLYPDSIFQDDSSSVIEPSYCDQTPLTESKAIDLLTWINKRLEEQIQEKKKESEALRLIHIDNMERYKHICMELDLVKENALYRLEEEIKIKFGVSNNEIMNALKPVCPFLVEKKLLKHTRIKFQGQTPDKEFVHRAFGCFLNRTLEELKKLSLKYKDKNENEDIEERDEELIVMKYRINDEIRQKFELDENKLKYLFFK